MVGSEREYDTLLCIDKRPLRVLEYICSAFMLPLNL